MKGRLWIILLCGGLVCAVAGHLWWKEYRSEYRRSRWRRAFAVRVNLEELAPNQHTDAIRKGFQPAPLASDRLVASKQQASKRYLTRFGYIDPDATTNDVLDGGAATVERFQRNMGIRVTSQLDDVTREAMSSSRCALPDVDPLGAMALGPWTKKSLRYSFGHILMSLNGSDLRTAVRDAFATWAEAGVGLAFVETLGTPDISIEWRPGTDPDYDMSARGLVAHSDFPPGFSLIVSSAPLPLHFNESETWSLGASLGKYDVETVALHEIGHCLGLPHSNLRSSIMYPVMLQGALNRKPSPDDIANLKALYSQDR